jgi:hypothetical protein
MKKQKMSISQLVLILLLSCAAPYAWADWSVDLESGLAFNGYNDVRIPGDIGTDLSLSEELEADATAFVRIRLSKNLGDRQQLSLLVAPLRFRSSGSVDRDIDFNGVRFPADTPLESRYRFDSYRLTYHYTLLEGEKLRAGLGLTAKIRDASIQIEGGGDHAEKTNTGFVPLVNFAVDWRFGSSLGLIFEGDALAAPQGRAEDVLLAFYGHPADKFRLRVGYRILEGGADNDEVYTFALVHYISAGIMWSF